MHAVSLQAPYLDTAADQLCFSLDLTERPALAEREVLVGELTVRMRLLGASHQVFAGPVRETVACLPGAVKGLPTRHTRQLAGWSYGFGATTARLDPDGFSARVAGILARVADAEHSLCGVFPGSPEAVTAVVVEASDEPSPARLAWRTWHTYPQDGHIVSTHTRLEAR
ncbi:hypothetical protein SAM23877_7158 [Streptomyces ambofaciens ATCC 23877]|uniref:DUF2617 domain-containing protein n=2 Tax=Streptomyces ambofaciens TaxID=1889 RepID=A0ACE1_STRA7|nr:DUF2617 family protein [Streptomyces ambofaciens]AKZ60201.1 hypothetical protein SAM23877_7158 [Streptomyces ambofaciens ATCC 23877]ANB10410.1 hypothetical protein SAM40697_6457 [Streptomyces ambofaciens]CAJ88145.1 conserved hypothetical protein [Streptomyces ambofaciens ATCC 23877]